MPRSYIITDEKGETQIVDSQKAYGSIEASVLGNTDFDAIYNPITAFNFVLEVEGVYFLPIKSVRAFTKENEFEYIREGGVNDYVHLKRKPISKPFTFQIERYCGTERFLDPLANGTELILPLILYVYRHKSRQGLSESAPAWPARVYTFTGCTVMSKEYGELNAEKAGLVTETTTISYRELIVLTNPFKSDSEMEEWKFKENSADKKGNVKNKYAAVPAYDKPGDTYLYKTEFNEATGMYAVTSKDSNKYFKKYWDGSTVKPSWAKQATPDANNSTYTEEPGEDGQKHIKRVDHQEFNKPMWDGKKGTSVAWATESNPDKAKSTYQSSVENGVTTITRVDEGDFNRKAYSIKEDQEKAKYAQVAPKDKNAAAAVYKKDGNSVKRVDTSDENKAPYSIKKDQQTPKWAKSAPNNDAKPEVKAPFDIKYDGAEAKYAAVSPRDKEKPEAKEPYQYGLNAVDPKWAKSSPRDKEKPEQKPAYEIKTDKTNNKYAKTSPRDKEKPEEKAAYSMSSDKTTNKYAKPSPKDKEKPEEKAAYGIRSDGTNNKWATKSPKDGEKPQAMDPYSITADKTTNKYAKTSSKDKPLATPVTWPPTRRALMADQLKK